MSVSMLNAAVAYPVGHDEDGVVCPSGDLRGGGQRERERESETRERNKGGRERRGRGRGE
jgi:hypothetical protein